MGELAIIYAVLIGGALVLQFLLYKGTGNNNLIFILNMLLVIIISAMLFSSQPSNYVMQKVISAAWGVIALLAFFLKSKGESSLGTSKLMLTIALVGAVVQMMF